MDIDQLAQQLSKAAQHRRSLHQSPLEDREQDFDVDEFEVVQSLGYLSVRVTEPKLLAGSTVAEAPTNNAAVMAFVARYFSGKPYQYPVLTLLKQYLPGAKAIAENEFRALSHLATIPEEKWEAASSTDRNGVPVVQMLGYFRGTPGESSTTLQTSGMQQSLWFVYKWEGMKPLSAYFSAEQTYPGVIWPWAKSKQRELNARHKMLRSILRGVLEAASYCHSKGVVHGSLGTGSVLLSTFDDYSAEELVVKLDNFGFASYIPNRQGAEAEGDRKGSKFAVELELRSVGLLFLETVILSLTEIQDLSTQSFVERLATEIFRDDFVGLKEYCLNEPNWAQAVLFLNEREEAGWKLLENLLDGDVAACLEHRFLD